MVSRSRGPQLCLCWVKQILPWVCIPWVSSLTNTFLWSLSSRMHRAQVRSSCAYRRFVSPHLDGRRLSGGGTVITWALWQANHIATMAAVSCMQYSHMHTFARGLDLIAACFEIPPCPLPPIAPAWWPQEVYSRAWLWWGRLQVLSWKQKLGICSSYGCWGITGLQVDEAVRYAGGSLIRSGFLALSILPLPGKMDPSPWRGVRNEVYSAPASFCLVVGDPLAKP